MTDRLSLMAKLLPSHTHKRVSTARTPDMPPMPREIAETSTQTVSSTAQTGHSEMMTDIH
jgi:hypothetical protein